jgi:hypothetical protein
MPLYEFTNEELGLTALVPFSIAERPDEIVLKRAAIPSRISVGVGARPPTQGEKLAQGYKKLEDMGGLMKTAGKDYLPISAIKEAIATPDHEPAVTA